MQLPVVLLSLATLALCQIEIPDQPTPVDGNIKGSSMCRTITPSDCEEAIAAFADDALYKDETHFTSARRHLMPVFPWTYITGCQAKFWCDKNDYGLTGDGVWGKTLRDA